MRQKILKIILFISFLPYAWVILRASYCAIFGYDVYTWISHHHIETLYGFEAFQKAFGWNVVILSIFPVLPVCLLYQILYVILWLFTRAKARSKADESSRKD